MPRREDIQNKKQPPPKQQSSGKNRANTKAKQRRHAARISAAARRRQSREHTVPMNAMVELASLPAKARDKIVKTFPADVHVNKNFTTGPKDAEEPIMVPIPCVA